MSIDIPVPMTATAPAPVAPAPRGEAGVLRCKMRRPASVDRQRWRQVMLHACSQGRIGGLQSFSIDDDVASLSVTSDWAQEHPAVFATALSELDAELKRPASH
jgi:hypothetical protein